MQIKTRTNFCNLLTKFWYLLLFINYLFLKFLGICVDDAVVIPQYCFNIVYFCKRRCLLFIPDIHKWPQVFGTQCDVDRQSFIALYLFLFAEDLMGHQWTEESAGGVALVEHPEMDCLIGFDDEISHSLIL